MTRKIKDFNDFMECIKAGKKVTERDGKWLYYFEHGCICCKHKEEGYCLYNTAVEDEDLSRMEVEEPFKIAVGKCYKTRDGREAHCFFADECLDFFRFTIDGLMDVVETDKDGKQIIPGRFENEEMPSDIVDYLEDK